MNTKTLKICFLLLMYWPVVVAALQDKPNILLVLMDNLGYGELGVYGGGILRGAPTPNLDSLAKEGLQLFNFNVETQCTPSRAALMTGRYAVRTGNHSVPRHTPVYGLLQWEYTLAELLSDSGYATGIFGKWHLGNSDGRYPTDQGFDEWWGIAHSADVSHWEKNGNYDPDSHPHASLPHILEGKKGQPLKKLEPFTAEQRALIEREITEQTVNFMQRHAKQGQPFFAYVPYTLMHWPVDTHPDFKGKTGNGLWSDALAELDYNIGTLLDAIDDTDISENTVVIFTSDNGPDPQFRQQGSSGPWRGSYYTPLEGSLRVPFLMRWPGKIPAGSVSNEIVHQMDVFPTIARILGKEVPKDRAIDGVDQLDFFTGKQQHSNRESFVVYVGGKVLAIKWRDWKMHYKGFVDGKFWGPVVEYPIPRLFNLITDPKEEYNVMLDHTWARWPIFEILNQHHASLEKYPPIKPGTLD